MAYESAIQQWREGERRLHEIEPPRVRIAERVAERVYAELRRRLGSSFLLDELVDLYDAGTALGDRSSPSPRARPIRGPGTHASPSMPRSPATRARRATTRAAAESIPGG